jgi:hypothetical protein
MAKKMMGRRKFAKVMKEFEEGQLHASSKVGPVVTEPKQAVAIAYSETKRKKKKKKMKSK